MARTRNVLPAPSGPLRIKASPGTSAAPSARAKRRVARRLGSSSRAGSKLLGTFFRSRLEPLRAKLTQQAATFEFALRAGPELCLIAGVQARDDLPMHAGN